MSTGSRPTREYLHMQSAFQWARRSTCSQPNRQIGAVITTADMRQILSFGYNGPAKGLPNDWCANGSRVPGDVTGDLPIPSRCNCLHAEMNAIAYVDGSISNKMLFVTMEPCIICAQLAINANVTKVFYSIPYRNEEGKALLIRGGIRVERLTYPQASE